MSGAAREERYTALLQERYCLILGKQLRESAAYKGGIYLRLHSHGTENLRGIDTVHHGSQHADLVRLGTLHILAGTASPEVAAADDDTHLNAIIHQSLDLLRHAQNRSLIKACVLLAGESLTA